MQMEMSSLLGLPDGLEVVSTAVVETILTIHVVATAKSSTCPLCAQPATRIRSSYMRQVADAPCAVRRVQLILSVRKFRCETVDCPRQIFTERLAPFLKPWARMTTRLSHMIEAIGVATCGELGSRLAPRLGIQISPTTVLRSTMALPTCQPEQVSLLGIDDWSFRRGRKFGTILVDLATHKVIDLLPDRTTETAAMWLQEHPEIDIVSRDRGGDYAAAARKGAPQALQVADRFHLAQNLTDRIEIILARCRAEICQATLPPESLTDQTSEHGDLLDDWRPALSPEAQQTGLARQEERLDRYHQLQTLQSQGLPTKEIARRVGMAVRTVERWLIQGIPHTKPRRKRSSCFDPYATVAFELWQSGCNNSVQLWQQLQTKGYKGSYRTVHRFVETLPDYSKRLHGTIKRCKEVPENLLQNFKAQEAVWLFVRDPCDLEKKEQEEITAICLASPTAHTVYTLAQQFMRMIRQLEGEHLDDWLDLVRTSHIPELQPLAKSIERDKTAVVAGLTLRHNNGVVEGKVNKLKLIKRMMFGRAGFPLLRQRVLHAL
jgi:transposase